MVLLATRFMLLFIIVIVIIVIQIIVIAIVLSKGACGEDGELKVNISVVMCVSWQCLQ
jgi:hypothetical protein